MELDLKQIGATILIGAFVFLMCEVYLHYFLGVDLTGFFRGRFGFESDANLKSPEVAPPIPFTVFVGIVILIAILAEDLAVRFVETKPRLLATAFGLAPTKARRTP